ncbi:uncharacterized protein LOC123705527 isoform X1 [Colias croceus]|uniref:uncharacterized protein LOC123705527 isoform X1 n=1 Tax=Colias crocea TaxID=72248 RepID=UPI001E279F84|nr:uncharacterized protein LOC123705527 isoform X1 [Colias croceus]XP_045510302.1 uncharacterized protein LOC123705527 isoform X1 [Colias croceus]
MPVTRFKPVPANESSASDEESKLELYLQQQLEEDVARIFDESIYSDLEVVCGKLKILTHTCILKARTNKFYHKLETILHVNIERHTFDEIYSFISDAYTECDIKTQEREIIKYLKANFLFLNTDKAKTGYAKEEEADVFLTPKCVSPYAEGKILKLNGTSPNTELTREYYALVPIEGNLLEQELSEQDALSNAFHSIIKTQNKDPLSENLVQHVKPTTLSLISSHSSKTVKHSISCDIISNCRVESNSVADNKVSKENNIPNRQKAKPFQQIESKNTTDRVVKKTFNSDCKIDRAFDSACSPDSLITDDPSSSSDYLSAAFNCSPGLGSIEFFPQLNVGENFTKMDNIFTSSDSGLENTGMLESLSSHKDVTLTDFSLTESALHESGTDDQNPSIDCTSNSYAESDQCLRFRQFDTNADTSLRSLTSVARESEGNGHNDKQVKQKDVDHSNTSKEEKQRQNEEIVILESSSVSSETGSWESIFPPKGTEKEICEKFLNNERLLMTEHQLRTKQKKSFSPPSAQIEKVECKPTPCFIDASSLVDEEEQIKVQVLNDISRTKGESTMMPSQPLPCSTTHKLDISPGDWSESNDNDDSLEQADNKDLDSIQKDLSPTIFEMTPITEDSLCTNAFESAVTNRGVDKPEESQKCSDIGTDNESLSYASTVYVATTPHNSILSVNTSSVKQFDIEETSNDSVTLCEKTHVNLKKSRCDESSPIVSGGSSLVSRTPQFDSNNCNLEAANDLKSHENVITSSWVVDMSFSSKSDTDKNLKNYYAKKPGDKVCEGLKSESKDRPDGNSKSRGSVDSDSSEKSSHKFYIDLSSLPDPLPPKNPIEIDTNNEKKNIFSMYIDLGDKAPVKEMPVRLSSSLNVKKQNEPKPSLLPSKTNKPSKNSNTKNIISTAKIIECESVFEEIESLCNDPNISITEIIGIPDKSKSSKVTEVEKDIVKEKKHSRSVNGENKLKQNSIPVIHEEITNKSSGDLFVRLSDLDKPVQKSEISMHEIRTEKENIDVRMTRSIPDHNWGEQNSSMASRSIEVLSSFHSENALSLNRLFPHLKNEFSKSMPGSLSARTRSPFRPNTIISPGEVEDQASDVSELSSVQSSMCRSVVENSTTEETSQTSSLIGNCQSRLGQDLLRMFLEEIAPDVIVEVSGKRIKAHKCILSSRCQYFAGILSGGWVESAGNVIVLPPFSFNVVHFALCHIYSGLSTIPDSISIVELATIADMLGLEGLKEAIMFTLKAKYCHHFHRPCHVCTAGVLECFPLSSVYGLDDLYRKCLRWITKYFSKVWPTKAFATLPKELLDKCYQEHIVNLSTENLIDTVYGCGITVASLQNSRWAETVARMCRRLVNAVAHFAAPRLVCVLEMIASVPNDAPQSAKQALDDCLTAAIEWAPPDETCRAYAFLSNLVKEIRSNQYSKPDLISNGNEQMKIKDPNNLLCTHAGSWRLQCEGTLVRAAPRVVGTQAFKDLPSDLRKRLRELGCIMYGPQAIPITSSPLQDRKSKSVYQNKPNKPNNYTTASRSLDMEQVRQSFVPYKAKPISMGGTEKLKSNNELREKKPSKGIPPKVRTTKAQEERAKFNQIKTNLSQDRLNTKARPHPFENTKPRYLEPRPCKDDNKKLSTKKLMNKIVSSSESSRNSSPVLPRNLRISSAKAKEVKAQTMSQDSLATSSRPRTAEPSTDSLSESQTSNKYATYTKTKHTCRGSVESVRSSKGVVSSMHSSNNRTKIPVYLNQTSVPNNYEYREPEVNKRPGHSATNRSVEAKVAPASPKFKNKMSVRNIPGSLMNATKSSSAKMVTKIVKDGPQTNKLKPRGTAIKNPRQNESDRQKEIPVMGRSGTFLKDEPTFGDKTTNIDICQ